MGCNHSKPYKKTSDEVIGAYQWDEKECGCGTNTFKLVESPEKKPEETDDFFPKVQAIIEPKLQLAVDTIMETATRGCCCDPLNFKETVSELNKGWSVDINQQLEQESLGCKVDAFTWSEWQHNGQTTYKRNFLVIRIVDVGVTVAGD